MILQALDFTGIEARVNAWIFDEAWKLAAFRAQDDGSGPDLYKLTVARMLRKKVTEVTKAERQSIGKTVELAFGFEGGVGAIVTACETYSVNPDKLMQEAYPAIPPDVLADSRRAYEDFFKPRGMTHGLSEKMFVTFNALKLLWRNQNSKITAGFRSIKEGAELAIRYPGKVYRIPNGKIKFKVEGKWLYMRLPSGRKLAYYEPKVEGEDRNTTIYFKGVDTETRQWTRTSTYGGKLVENAVQATARDLLVHGMFNLERAGYTVIGHIHDEVVSEIPEEFGSLERAGEIMCELPDWAAGLPVKYSGWRSKRFKKE